jgi:hypothetical protein
MTSPRVTPEGLLGVTDDPAAALRYPSFWNTATVIKTSTDGVFWSAILGRSCFNAWRLCGQSGLVSRDGARAGSA